MRARPLFALLSLAALSAGCADPQRHVTAPAFSVGGAAACPIPANVVVTDEAGLNAALAGAQPGEVIGLGAFFGVGADVFVATANVTLTCATAGAGLFATNPAVVYLLQINSPGVTVDRLVLDASGVVEGSILADNDGVSVFATGTQFTRNTVTCGPGSCMLFAGSAGAVVSDNSFTANGTFTGVHIQEDFVGTDNTVVARNTIVATAPSIAPAFGGIRIRAGSGVTVSDNVVTGPWQNSLSPANLTASVVVGNRFEGAQLYGVRMSANSPFFMTQTTFRNNRVTGAALAGIFALRACGNAFNGNNLNGNAGDLGLIFPDQSGANVVSGNQNVVIDNGAWDCNGDGMIDPNVIGGKGKVLHGVALTPLPEVQPYGILR